MKEIEIKILEINVSKIRNILRKHHARFVKKVFQQNFLYENVHTRKNKLVVRVRREGSRTILTLKEKMQILRNHKIREEYEMYVDYRMISRMLYILGLKHFRTTEIKREYWTIMDCSVEICILPKIPAYLEIEGSEKNIAKVAYMLGYSKKDYFNKSVTKHYKIKNKYLIFT